MKKIYMSPEVKVVVIKRRPQLLAGSVQGFDGALDDDGGDGGAALAPEHEWYEWRF